MPKAYWTSFYEKIAEPEIQKKYAEKATVAIKKFGGVFFCGGGASICLEGSKSPRIVIVEFPSYESAEKCYNSKEYKEALNILKNSAKRNLQIVEGFSTE